MSLSSIINFRLNSGDSAIRLEAMALSAERVREHFKHLPRDLRHSSEQLFRFSQIQERSGRLSQEQQRAAQFHLGHIRQHHAFVRQQVGQLQQATTQHALYAQYNALRAGGTRGLNQAVKANPAMMGLHTSMQQLSQLQNQNAALAQVGNYQQNHLPNPGTGHGIGGWIQDNASKIGVPNAVKSIGRKASMVAGALTAFSVAGTIHRGMEEFEERMVLGQELGAQLSNSFEQVVPALEKMQRRFALTRAEIVPGLREMVRLTGSLNDEEGGLSEQALTLARARGLDPSDVMSTFANNRLYSTSNDLSIVGRLINYSAPNMPQGMMDLFGTALKGMGGPGLAADPESAARWAALMPRAFGPSFAGPRGSEMLQQLMGGVGRTGGSPVTETLRLMAAQKVGPLRVGGVLYDPKTVRGARAIQESRDPRYYERLYGEAVNAGGKTDQARELFQEFSGLGTIASDRLFLDMQKHGGRLPSATAIRRTQDTTDQLRGVQGTEAYKWQQTTTGLELDVFAKVGEALKPAAEVFREVALKFGLDVTKAGGIIEISHAIVKAYTELGNHGEGVALVRDVAVGGLLGGKTAAAAGVADRYFGEWGTAIDRLKGALQQRGWVESPK